MTKKERIEQAAEIMKGISLSSGADKESSHIVADRLLCKILRQEGYVCAANIFEAMPKWYS